MKNADLHTGHRERLRKRLTKLLVQALGPLAIKDNRLCQAGQYAGCDFTGICRSDVANAGVTP